jgi:hypothetical protein
MPRKHDLELAIWTVRLEGDQERLTPQPAVTVHEDGGRERLEHQAVFGLPSILVIREGIAECVRSSMTRRRRMQKEISQLSGSLVQRTLQRSGLPQSFVNNMADSEMHLTARLHLPDPVETQRIDATVNNVVETAISSVLKSGDVAPDDVSARAIHLENIQHILFATNYLEPKDRHHATIHIRQQTDLYEAIGTVVNEFRLDLAPFVAMAEEAGVPMGAGDIRHLMIQSAQETIGQVSDIIARTALLQLILRTLDKD